MVFCTAAIYFELKNFLFVLSTDILASMVYCIAASSVKMDYMLKTVDII